MRVKRTSRRHGMHFSVSGGLPRALERAADLGCTALQIFSRNPRGWGARPLGAEEAAGFREARERLGLDPVLVHTSYLINLASRDPAVRGPSIEAFRDELVRASRIGADYLVAHPGSPRNGSPADGVAAAVGALKKAASRLALDGLTVLIENTAGQGRCIGRRFEEVADIIEGCSNHFAVGACLDTAHALAAGYELRTPKGFQAAMRALGETIGFERVRAIHFNDSKAAFGSGVDRHWHIGEGAIGYDGLKRIARCRPLAHAAVILETPDDEVHDDLWNLERFRAMLR